MKINTKKQEVTAGVVCKEQEVTVGTVCKQQEVMAGAVCEEQEVTAGAVCQVGLIWAAVILEHLRLFQFKAHQMTPRYHLTMTSGASRMWVLRGQ